MPRLSHDIDKRTHTLITRRARTCDAKLILKFENIKTISQMWSLETMRAQKIIVFKQTTDRLYH